MSGFAGVGGAFIVTPALIVLGFPANLAVGTSMAWITGNSIIGMLRHRKIGNVDMKFGIIMIIAAMGGTEAGVRIFNSMNRSGNADSVVLIIAVCLLTIVGSYTLIEAIRRKKHLDRILAEGGTLPPPMSTTAFSTKVQGINLPPIIHFKKSGVTISVWIVVIIGFAIGMLAGIMGVGGGFIMVPSLVYVVGMPSFMAVGTPLFQMIFSSSYGFIRHTMSGNVIIMAAFIMLIASSIGVQFGAITTRYVRGVSVRYILGISIITFAIGSALKLCGVLIDGAGWAETASQIITFGGLGLTVIMILSLLIVAIRYKRGNKIPSWMYSFVSKSPE